jgi:tagatose 6-phosphate kinase
LAREAGALSILDASGPALPEALTGQPGLVKPNRAELEKTFDRSLTDEVSLRKAMADLHGGGAQRVVITSGSQPALAFDGRRCWRIIAPRIRAVNPIGSGDAFTAALTWRLAAGDDLGEACRWGCATGAANALTTMAGEVDVRDIERLRPEVRIDVV